MRFRRVQMLFWKYSNANPQRQSDEFIYGFCARQMKKNLNKKFADLDRKGAVFYVGILLVVAVFLVFGQTVWHGFVNYDDEDYFYGNPHVKAGLTWSGVTWAFQTGYAANWHPLTWLSLMLDAQLFGTGAAGPHLTNVLLHAASTVLLFLLLTRMTGAFWKSAFVAALFGLHPLHVESVAWVSERKDVLSGLFFMLTLLMYGRYAQGSQTSDKSAFTNRDYWLAILFFALGLMSKPMLVTVPFVLLLLDYWPLKRFAFSNFAVQRKVFSSLVIEKLPFIVLSVASSVVTVMAQQEEVVAIGKLSVLSRMSNIAASYVTYLGQMVYPVRLAVFYPYSMNEILIWKITLTFVFLAGISAGVFILRGRSPYLLTGWLWYLGMLVPVIGFVQVGGQAHADRYTYLPLIGVLIMLTWAAVDLFNYWRCPRQAFGVAAIVVIVALMVCASIQTSYWRNSESLWTHTLACTSNNYVAHNDLGSVLAKQGRLAEAIEHYQIALEINPHYAEAHNGFGILLAEQGQSMEAIQHFQKALEIKPDFAAAHNDLGNALADQGRFADAIEHYEKALEIKPDYAEAHYNLGNALAIQGRFADAIKQFQLALQIRPDDVKAENSLRAALALQQQSTKQTDNRQTP
jgi:protein O-mannosyl-transferase